MPALYFFKGTHDSLIALLKEAIVSKQLDDLTTVVCFRRITESLRQHA